MWVHQNVTSFSQCAVGSIQQCPCVAAQELDYYYRYCSYPLIGETTALSSYQPGDTTSTLVLPNHPVGSMSVRVVQRRAFGEGLYRLHRCASPGQSVTGTRRLMLSDRYEEVPGRRYNKHTSSPRGSMIVCEVQGRAFEEGGLYRLHIAGTVCHWQ